MTLDYDSADAPIRSDLRNAQQAAWEHLAAPGTWWTGSERVSIAAETRRALTCGLCTERAAALSPATATGRHDAVSELPEHVREVIHRIRTDPGRLSRGWFDDRMAAGLEPAPYV